MSNFSVQYQHNFRQMDKDSGIIWCNPKKYIADKKENLYIDILWVKGLNRL